MTALLELRGVTKRFGAVTVADALDLEVAAGEAVGIVGPNGAGKSSLFGLVSGDLRPDAGRIRLAGRDITAEPTHRRSRAGLGRTYQVPRPFGAMTVFENVLVPCVWGAGLTTAVAQNRALEVLARCGLADRANVPAGRLPLLDRKRLEVARGLATAPDVLLLDEVAGGLTEPEVLELVTVVRDVLADGVAVVWIEHVVHALTEAVQRLLCLADGRFVADGAPADVLTDHAVREVYFGAGPDLIGAEPS